MLGARVASVGYIASWAREGYMVGLINNKEYFVKN